MSIQGIGGWPLSPVVVQFISSSMIQIPVGGTDGEGVGGGDGAGDGAGEGAAFHNIRTMQGSRNNHIIV
jgi:hypothetical protein